MSLKFFLLGTCPEGDPKSERQVPGRGKGMEMTSYVDSKYGIRPASPQWFPARLKGVRARIADAWPSVMVGFGVVLTIAWTGGLSWLAVCLLLMVI
jgi:hypothetical protein